MKRRRLLLLGLIVLAVAPTGLARADTTTASTSAEAWYAPPPTCALPTGCGPTDSLPPPPASRYPAGTLHVGVTGGVEDARTYLKLDLSGVPSDATLTGATLTIPVAPAADGSASPETAQVVACFMGVPFAAADGSLAPPPAVDCSTTATAAFRAGPPMVLSVNLSAFVSRWAGGEANNGIALLPVAGTAPGTTWHVAFSSRARTGSSSPPARAELLYTPAALAPVPEPTPEPVDTGAGTFSTEPFAGIAAPVEPTPSPVAPIVAQSKLPARLSPVVQLGGPGFAYPVILVLPLLLLALGGYLGWALTRPVVPSQR